MRLVTELRSPYLVLTSNSSLSFTTSEDQDLIHGVHFIANVATNRNLHGDDLAVKSRVQYLSELPKSSHFGGELGEIHHLMLRWSFRHFAVFTVMSESRREESRGAGGWPG